MLSRGPNECLPRVSGVGWGYHVFRLTTLSGPLWSQPHLPSTCYLPQCWRQLSSHSGNFHVDSLYSLDGRFLLYVVIRFTHRGETALLRFAGVLYSHTRFHIVSCGLYCKRRA